MRRARIITFIGWLWLSAAANDGPVEWTSSWIVVSKTHGSIADECEQRSFRGGTRVNAVLIVAILPERTRTAFPLSERITDSIANHFRPKCTRLHDFVCTPYDYGSHSAIPCTSAQWFRSVLWRPKVAQIRVHNNLHPRKSLGARVRKWGGI